MSKKAGFELFSDFEQKKEILVEDIDLIADYIYNQINTGYRVRKLYGYSCYLSKIRFMLTWKKERGLNPKTVKLGEAICYKNKKEGELVNFLEDEAHSIAFCNCGSAWWGEA